jgi:hypothetical protein
MVLLAASVQGGRFGADHGHAEAPGGFAALFHGDEDECRPAALELMAPTEPRAGDHQSRCRRSQPPRGAPGLTIPGKLYTKRELGILSH